MDVWLTLAVATILALVHIFGNRLRFLNVIPRCRWLSAASGVSIAYVFLHIMPELQQHHERLMRREGLPVSAGWIFEHYLFLLSMLGLVCYYGLERFAVQQARWAGAADVNPDNPPGWFWVHIGAFAIYNLLIGYLLLHREDMTLRGLGLFALAISLHFLVNDKGMREHHGVLYLCYGRWVLAVAPLLGWGTALFIQVHPLGVATLFAFLSGGIILNVLKEELPENRESRFSALAAGAAGYGALLLVH